MIHSIGLSERATKFDKHYQFAHQRLLRLCEELDELPYESEEDCVVSGGPGSEKYCEIISCEQSQDTTLLDPPVAATKGRPRSLRMKGALEVTQKTKKITSQKQKRQTKSMKFKRKETSSNYSVKAEQNGTTISNEAHLMDIIKDLLRTLVVLMPHRLRNNGKEEVILACIQKQNDYSFIDLHIPASRVKADDMNDLARLILATDSPQREKADQRLPETTESQWRGETSGAGGARHHCFAVECEREATLASGEENEVGEGAVMVVKRFFCHNWWCNGLGCCFCRGWKRKKIVMVCGGDDYE
ncbi:hypothetical protein H5410_032963 [Solanum commersonii]|uniref:Uncharacterized protein n=1 Tax=Solanum commersonii TaxID=4109 RepID=A0A9J5YMG6_SOLCO|nr:hypothetical protein H5410_032963 [Solanum commersonii]